MRHLLAGIFMGFHLFHPSAVMPPAATVPAFDTTATISGTAWFRSMYARGFRLYILHSTVWGTCEPWSQTQDQLENALSAGLKVAVYTRDPRCWQGGIEAAGPFVPKLQFFALDIETDPGVAVTRAMVSGVRALGVRSVIYTGADMWPAVQRFDDERFADVPLWDADVSGDGPVPYGGWNTPANPRALVQQALDVDVDGVVVDLDSVSASFLR